MAMPGVLRTADQPLNSMRLGVFPDNEQRGVYGGTLAPGNTAPTVSMAEHILWAMPLFGV